MWSVLSPGNGSLWPLRVTPARLVMHDGWLTYAADDARDDCRGTVPL